MENSDEKEFVEVPEDSLGIHNEERNSPSAWKSDNVSAGRYRVNTDNCYGNIRTVKSGNQSNAASVLEGTDLKRTLEDVGLEQHYSQKLSLSEILQITRRTIDDQPPKCKSELPWYFLKKLMMVNVAAINVKCTPEQSFHEVQETAGLDLDSLLISSNSADTLNPLDIITALFLCSDGFVQQALALKMSMCQFAVPLLLPNCDKNQSTLMLWATRDIVKKYRPESLSQSKGFIEERIVLSELPMISFVRLGECSLSKSEILNKLLSSSQQYHDTFVHRNMDSGDIPRKISSGLTEMTWYLPCGNENIDIFSQPVAVANLRGDITCFETQFSFLCETSAAVFVFFDDLNPECKLLNNQHKSKMFLVGNAQSRSFTPEHLKQVAHQMSLTNNNIILKNKSMNDAVFVKNLRKTVSDIVQKTEKRLSIKKMTDVAHELGIVVDEDDPDCQAGKRNADAITKNIQDIIRYKEIHFPLQDQIWKELSSLEKEEFRLRNVGNENIENYRSDLLIQKIQLRARQNSSKMSSFMASFVRAMSRQEMERCFFLKWSQINLDDESRIKLSGLRDQYKEKCKTSGNKEEIKKIDQQLSNSSLGIEHFFREMGQMYEASRFLPETDPCKVQFNHLPKLCAQLLLDGFPIELVDGDASNIPLKWVSEVLSELNDMVSPKNKILVVTVLGVQSTGKSTLLNTMFGVQFAVSSGRCTRGAFMLLIRIDEEFKKELNCDFLMIIDTEGLKSPELAQLDNSYEHDNELATLVVGLSDITIINIAMENSTEMKDILQIVVHAFLRMKEVGKKPKCYFVHQNVSDVSAHEKNLRHQKLLLQQLNEMTQAAARMEKKEENKSFTDVMNYNPDTGNWYIHGLWTGNPPMAPVNTGYSETVYALKKNLIQQLQDCTPTANNILEFREWMASLWKAVKHENFIFSFRNSLAADAYMKLCTEFNKWEWDFKKEMYNWITKAETKISNFGTVASTSQKSDLEQLVTDLRSEADTVLCQWETKFLDNLKQYFKQTEGHVYLVEGYKQQFENSARSLRKETQRSVLDQLTVAIDMKRILAEVNKMKENHTKEIEKAVCGLIDECQEEKVEMTDTVLDKKFEKMWGETVMMLTIRKQEPTNIFTNVYTNLRTNLTLKGSHVCQLLGQKRLEDCGHGLFTFEIERWKKYVSRVWPREDKNKAAQQMADKIIGACKMVIFEKETRKINYHETYIQEILRIIHERLQNTEEVQFGIEFEVALKQHICGFAARKFQKMHEGFIQANDPESCLMKHKEKFCADFKDVFHKRDQCQKKAEEFTKQCLRPAVENFVDRELGPSIVSKMRGKSEFSTRMSFQYKVLKDLLLKQTFGLYLFYTLLYESYVKEWIIQQMKEHYSGSSSTFEIENSHLESCISSIHDAISKVKEANRETLKTFIEDICKELGDKLVISQDALGAFMILNNADGGKFAVSITDSVNDMAETLRKTLKEETFETKLKRLHMQPQDELFNRVIGCGKQCPFCKVPCDAGGDAHTEHFAAVHRPEGLGRYHSVKTSKLVTDICTSSVISGRYFRCQETKKEVHPYKCYREIFPDWNIQPDRSLEASDYWKYVMVKYNNDFAKEYEAKPADIPETWKKITYKQAEESLQKSFGVQ